MEFKVQTRFNIGDSAFFLDVNHDITKGIVKKIESKCVIYKDNYTEQQSTFVGTKYVLRVRGLEDEELSEECLFSTPDEILAMFNDQVENKEFD